MIHGTSLGLILSGWNAGWKPRWRLTSQFICVSIARNIKKRHERS